jgi:hypothetical protein
MGSRQRPTDCDDSEFNAQLQRLVKIHSDMQACRAQCKTLTEHHLAPHRSELKRLKEEFDGMCPNVMDTLTSLKIDKAVLTQDGVKVGIRICKGKNKATLTLKDLKADLKAYYQGDEESAADAFASILARHLECTNADPKVSIRKM